MIEKINKLSRRGISKRHLLIGDSKRKDKINKVKSNKLLEKV
jgi:hypothetical protein